jgi:hypothetical protein
MLHISRETLQMLRSVQIVVDERLNRIRRAHAEERHRQLKQKRFDNIVAGLAPILKDGRPTVFANEAACRHGVRRTLCLQGWKWGDADSAADAVVALALRQVGAERPTWLQGQPGYTEEGFSPIERTRCARCFCRLPALHERRGQHQVYCSDVCRTSAAEQRARETGERVDRATYLAELTARVKQRAMDRDLPCEQCGIRFDPGIHYKTRKFCSSACAHEAKRRGVTMRAVKCIQCDSEFLTKQLEAKYCGTDCYNEARRSYREGRSCAQCGTGFHPRRETSRFCSNVCKSKARLKPRIVCEQVPPLVPKDEAFTVENRK